MGKIDTTTESLEHISTVINEVTVEIANESKRLLTVISDIQEKTQKAIANSELKINSWKSEVSSLEEQIDSFRLLEDEENDYQSQILACESQISELKSEIRKERLRNNELRRTASQFRQQSIQVLKVTKQINLATESANTSGKQYLSKKLNLLTYEYGKITTSIAAIGAGLGIISQDAGSDDVNDIGITNRFLNNGNSGSELYIEEFKNELLAAQEWGKKSFFDWNTSLSVVERQAFIDYKKELYPHDNSYYVNINSTLRGRGIDGNNIEFQDGNQMRYIRMHNALSRARVPNDVIAYRAVSRAAYDSMRDNANAAGYIGGLRDNGFMSCSLIADNNFVNSNEVIMRLTITEGTRGAYIGNVGNAYEEECELLLDCGSSIFVTNIIEAPRSTVTGYIGDTDMITIIEGVVEA